MDIEAFREYCISKPMVTEEVPFGPDTLVFKVAGKMFALTDIENFQSINLKCDPETAIQLREQYPDVKPGYHMNKRHWNTVNSSGMVGDDLLKQWIDDSYLLVVNGLPKKVQEEIKHLLS